MRKFQIQKRNGKFRTIYAPNAAEKSKLLELLPMIDEIVRKQNKHDVMHGFMHGRSPVTNALKHIGWKYTVCFDLKDFFDTVTPEHVRHHFMELPNGAAECFVDGAARQGLPTSPSVANLAACPMDDEIMSHCVRRRGFIPFVYTRYADDLTFSCDSMDTVKMLMELVPTIAKKHGFEINQSKTHVQCSKAGHRIITGVAVSDEGIHPTREAKRKLRAALHQNKHITAEGFKEWMRLRLPKAAAASRNKNQPATILADVPIATISSAFRRRIVPHESDND